MWLSDHAIQKTAAQGRKIFSPGAHADIAKLEWPGLIRKLERDRGTSYKT